MGAESVEPTIYSPFHEGEQLVQSRLGVREAIEPWARQVVRRFLPEQHREFYGHLPFVVAAARDRAGRPWATLLVGEPGFIQSPDPTRLVLETSIPKGDALADHLGPGSRVGLLGIELSTRRRNRVNGTVSIRDDGSLELEVGQAFGNCPQYIHPRRWRRRAPRTSRPAAVRSRRLSPAARTWIRGADTFFIASGYGGGVESPGDGSASGESAVENPAWGMDASHRGGEPGFVHVGGDASLIFPDYAGNNHFNTLGNLVLDPRAGLLFVDFERGSLLQLTGRARIEWDSEKVALHPGARRLVRFDIDEVVELSEALPLRWTDEGAAVRSLRVVEKIRESHDVTSFVLEARDGGQLTDFEAGQHLPLVLRVPDREEPVRRTYSLSGPPGGDTYRISVKREARGLVSRLLHDDVEPGTIVDVQAPAGEFVLEPTGRPVVLISAGVGLTPLVSMLHVLVAQDDRPVWFVHGARDGRHHPMAREVRELVERGARAELHVVYSRPRPEDRRGRDYQTEGRLDAGRVADLLPGLDADFYLCGPPAFLAELQNGLEERGVAEERIRVESFGPLA